MIVNGDTLRRTFDAYEDHMPVDADLLQAVHSRARSDRRKRLASIGGVLCALLLVGGFWLAETRSSVSGDVASEPPGKEVGERRQCRCVGNSIDASRTKMTLECSDHVARTRIVFARGGNPVAVFCELRLQQ